MLRRDDDNLETIRARLQTYRDTSDPIIRHYQDQSAIAIIDGSQSPDQVSAAIMQAIEKSRLNQN